MICKTDELTELSTNTNNNVILYFNDDINEINSFLNIWSSKPSIFNKSVICIGKRRYDTSLWLKLYGIDNLIVDCSYDFLNKKNTYTLNSNIYYQLSSKIKNQVY